LAPVIVGAYPMVAAKLAVSVMGPFMVTLGLWFVPE